MSENRQLNGMNWQEGSGGEWYCVVGKGNDQYKLVVLPRDPRQTVAIRAMAGALGIKEEEGVQTLSDVLTHEAAAYQWNNDLDTWILIGRVEPGSFGVQDAKFDAEKLLSKHLDGPNPGDADRLREILMQRLNSMREQRPPRASSGSFEGLFGPDGPFGPRR